VRHLINGHIVIAGERRGTWAAMQQGFAISGFIDYHCYITYLDDNNDSMFAEFMVRGVGINAHPMALASRVLGEGFHRLEYTNKEIDD